MCNWTLFILLDTYIVYSGDLGIESMSVDMYS